MTEASQSHRRQRGHGAPPQHDPARDGSPADDGSTVTDRSRESASPDAGERARPAFAHASEAEFARILDFYDVRWEYEPDTFPILWDLDGAVLESFSPDFHLPDMDLYVELTTLQQRLVRKKNRKVRRLRELYPDLRIKLFYARDFRALMLKYGRVALVDELSGSTGQATPPKDAPPEIHGTLERPGGRLTRRVVDRPAVPERPSVSADVRPAPDRVAPVLFAPEPFAPDSVAPTDVAAPHQPTVIRSGRVRSRRHRSSSRPAPLARGSEPAGSHPTPDATAAPRAARQRGAPRSAR